MVHLGTSETATPSVTDCLLEHGADLADALAVEPDLDKIKDAMIREYSIRVAMLETGEDRQTIVDMVGALESMGQEAVLELTSGAPTTLEDGLEAFLEGLDEQVHYSGSDIATAILAILRYPWPGEEATIATHGANASVGLRIERPDDEHLEIWVGGREVAQASHEAHGWAGMQAVELAAEAVHRAVLSRVIGDRDHVVQLGQTNRLDLLAFLDRPDGSWTGDKRLSVDAVEGGGVLIRTRPYKYVTPPQARR